MFFDVSNYKSSGINGYDIVYYKWHLNTLCQFRCDYCYFYDQLNKSESIQNKLAYKNVLKRLSLKSQKTFDIDLLGGEPTLHDNFNDIVSELCDNTKCRKIDIHTNMLGAIELFHKHDDYTKQKVTINGSYHPQYIKKYNGKFLQKSVELCKLDHISYICNINIHEQYWNDIKILINDLLSNDVPVGLQMLNDVDNRWKSNYTPEFISIFNRFINEMEVKYNRSLMKKLNVMFKTDNDTVLLDDYNVKINKLDNFFGWSCKALLWNIQPDGVFQNGCTGDNLSITGKNIDNVIKCPVKTGCPCADCYLFEKHNK